MRAIPLLATFPIVILFVALIDGESRREHSRRAVRDFISKHQKIVEKRLQNPKVHSFSLTPVPDDEATLLIQFDVDDKETFFLLDDDLRDCVELHNLPQWQTVVRSKERLGMDLGSIAQATGMVFEAPVIVLRVLAISFALWLVWVVPVAFICRKRAIAARIGEQSVERELPKTV
jgi:hypothetical protein